MDKNKRSFNKNNSYQLTNTETDEVFLCGTREDMMYYTGLSINQIRRIMKDIEPFYSKTKKKWKVTKLDKEERTEREPLNKDKYTPTILRCKELITFVDQEKKYVTIDNKKYKLVEV
jgi:hypothetical protein